MDEKKMTREWGQANLSPGDELNKKPRMTQMTQFFFLRVPLCNFVANFLVISRQG